MRIIHKGETMAKKAKKAKAAKPARGAKGKAKAAAKSAARTRALKNVPRTPRAQRLPTMTDTGIKALDNIGARYADIRDQRQALTREEVSLKQHTITLMHKHGKTSYVTDALEIHLEGGEESVTVKVKDAAKAKVKTTAAENSEPLEDSATGTEGAAGAGETPLEADEE